MNGRVIALTLFLIAILTQSVSAVGAQNTVITNLVYPSGIVSGETTTVTFDLSYSGLTKNEGLLAAIVNPATNEIAYGLVSSTPDQCISLAATQYVGTAACIWRLGLSSGIEHLTFNLQFPTTHIQAYGFEAVATIVTAAGTMLGTSQETFSITGGTTFELTVDTSYHVTLRVDGSANASSPLELTPGVHVVSVPTLVQLDNSSRLRFDHWEDGSTLPDRSVSIQADTTIAATFVRQYLLTLNSVQVNATGAGWYDEGSTAQFSVPSSSQMPGLLGAIGARSVFKGWYENGSQVTAANIGSVSMLDGHILNAQWASDYTIPIIILAGLVAIAGGSVFSIRHRRRGKLRRRRRKVPARRRAGESRRMSARAKRSTRA